MMSSSADIEQLIARLPAEFSGKVYYVALRKLRSKAAAEDVRVIDAKCIAESTAERQLDRTAMIRRILAQWAAEQHRQASVIVNVAGANPAFMDTET